MNMVKTFLIALVMQISNSIMAQEPKNSQEYVNRGKPNMGLMTDKALSDFTKAIRLDPKNSDAWYNRGLANDIVNDLNKALADYTEAIRLSPKFFDAWFERANVKYKNGLFAEAIADYNECIRLNSKSYYSFNNRGEVYRFIGEYEKAISDHSKAISLNPANSHLYACRSYVYSEIGEYEKAITDYKQCYQLMSDTRYSYNYIVYPLVRLLRFEEAKIYCNKYKSDFFYDDTDTAKNETATRHYINAVAENIPNNAFEDALANLNIALSQYGTEINPENKSEYTSVLSLKGYVLEQLNRNEEAIDIYNKALVINNLQPNVHEALARLNANKQIAKKADKTPPSIELISPQTSRGFNIVSANELTQIIGRAEDASGIAQISINGKVIKAEEDGLFVSNISLKAGINEIVVSATDKQGNKAEKTFNITGNIVAKKDNTPAEIIMPVAAAAPQYHALLIASQDYTDASIPDLENPVKDARELSTILQSNYTFPAKNIDTVYNRSREEIMQAIVQKCNTLTENDNLLIFYAGHGIGEKDKFGDVDGYWIPSSAKKGLNASYISSDDINKALKRSNAKHILVIADACFSGAFTRELPTDASVGVQKQYSVPSRKIMASGNMEPVPDNSRFVFYLKKNLTENKEKYLTSKKLFDSFYEAILNNSDTSPQYAAIKNVGDEGGEFVFIKK